MKDFEQDITLHRKKFKIIQKKEMEFNNPDVFVTFPGAGVVGPMISRAMIKSLELEEIGFFKSDSLSPVTMFMDNVLKHPYLMYANKEGTLVLITLDYPIPPHAYLIVAEGLMNWIEEELNSKNIICFDGIPVRGRPQESEEKLIITAAEKEVAEELKEYAVETYDDGVVLGLAGAIMSEALLREIVGMTLMTPATAKIPDPGAAIDLISVTNDYFNLNIDIAELKEQQEKIKEKLQLIAKRQQELKRQQEQPGRMTRESYA